MFEEEKTTREYLEEAYTTSLKEIEDHIRSMETPADILAKEEKEKLFEKAQELIGLKILNENITKEYLDLEKSIAESSEKIKKLYGISVTENSLSAVRSAFDRINEQIAQELAKNEDDFNKELERIEAEADEKIKGIEEKAEAIIMGLKAELQTVKDKFEVEYEREGAEFEYNLKRERKSAQEKRDEEVSERKAALKLREQETKERKEECEKRLEEIELLEEKVEDIPAKVEEAGKEGAREREFLINKANKYQTELSNKTEELRIGSLQTEYDRLLKKYEALEQDAANLSKRLDQCNMESRKLTSDTVRFIGGINILNPDTHQFNEAGGKNK